MATIAGAPKATKQYPLISQGTHVGIIYKFMNMGTRLQDFQGKPKDHKDILVSFTIEIPSERQEFLVKKEDGTEEKVEKPLVITREFTLSMGPKSNLRPFVEGVIGEKLMDEEAYAFNLEDLVGKACLVSIVHKDGKDGKTYANILSVSPLIKGMEVPKQYNKNNIFDVKTATIEEIEAIPEWIRNKVTVSDEYKNRFGSEELTAEDVPF